MHCAGRGIVRLESALDRKVVGQELQCDEKALTHGTVDCFLGLHATESTLIAIVT